MKQTPPQKTDQPTIAPKLAEQFEEHRLGLDKRLRSNDARRAGC